RGNQHHDDRQHHPAGVPGAVPLPDRCRAVVRLDGRARHRDRALRQGPGDARDRGVRVSTATVERPEVVREEPPPAPRKRRRVTRYVLPVYSVLVLVYLVLPILVMILYSFNNSGFKRVSFRWLGFTTEWYRRLFAIPDLTNSLKNSLIVAVISTL